MDTLWRKMHTRCRGTHTHRGAEMRSKTVDTQQEKGRAANDTDTDRVGEGRSCTDRREKSQIKRSRRISREWKQCIPNGRMFFSIGGEKMQIPTS